VRGGGHIFQNRSLILNDRSKPDQAYGISSTSTPEQVELSSDENSIPTPRGVAKYGRGAKAWISEDALRRNLERKKHLANSSHTAKDGAVAQQPVPSGSGTSSPSVGYINIDGIPFQVTNGGSKLLRSTGRLIYTLCRHRTRSDLDRHLGPYKCDAKRSNSQWSGLQAFEERQPCPCCNCAPRVRCGNGYKIFGLLTGLVQVIPAEREKSIVQTIHFDRYPSPVFPDLIQICRNQLPHFRKV
jgi:hypothetical protein